MIWLTKSALRSLEIMGARFRPRGAQHLLTGNKGELEAYLYLRSLGYRIVVTNFRVPYDRGEIDLIGWDKGVLCFIEVKTRTSADFAPPSTAVDSEKRKHIRSVARRYLRRLSLDRPPSCRFDIVSVIIANDGSKPAISVQKGAFNWAAGRTRRLWQRDFRERPWRNTRR